MKRHITLGIVAALCLSASPTFGQSLTLGTAEGQFDASVTLPLTLSTSPLDKPVQAVQAIFDWAAEAGTGLGLNIDPAIEASADFVSFHVDDGWMALGFTVVTAPLTGDDIPLAGVVIECSGPAATDTPVTFRDAVYHVGSLVLSNTVTVGGSSIRKANGLELIDGSFRCSGDEICDDAVDNDGDGLADGADPDCPANIHVSPLALDYGSVFIGTDRSIDVTIGNVGAKTLMVKKIEISTNSDFTLTDTPLTPAVLGPGEQTVVTVTYAPQEAEVDSGTLQILSDDGREPELNVALTGSGLATLAEGLGAHLPLDCSAEDLVSEETGAVIAFVGCAPDRFGDDSRAMAFDGNGWIDGNSFPVVTGDFILETWFRPDVGGSTTTSIFVIHHQSEPVQVPALSLEWDGQANLLILKRGDSPIAIEDLAAAWHHILISRELGNFALYIDGQLKSSSTDSDLLGGAYHLGADLNGSRLYRGSLDEIILEVSTLGSEAEAISRALRGGPSVYVHPSARVRDVTANPGFTEKALDIRLTTASSESGELELTSLTLVADDVTTMGGTSPILDYLENGRLVVQTEFGAQESEVTGGELVEGETDGGSATYTLTSSEPILLPVASEVCLVALFDLAADAPLDRVIQFRIDTLEDIVIVDAQDAGRYLVGERFVDKTALQGDRLKILEAPPPELELMFPVDMEPIAALASVDDAEMHALTLAAGDDEGLRLLDISYRATEGTSLDGLTTPRLFVDLNRNGSLDAGEEAKAGAIDVDANRIFFTGLGFEIPASSEIDLVLLAELELSDAAVTGGALAIPLLLAAGALLALLSRRYRCQPQLASALALVVVCAVIGIGVGCSGGGGGGGGGGAPATTQQSFQLTLDAAADVRIEGLTSGTEPDLSAFPANGIPGPLFILKG